jgi:hypothetical protein
LRNCSAFYTPSAAHVTKPSNLRRLSRSADRRHLPHDQVQGASLFREFVPYANGRGLSTRLKRAIRFEVIGARRSQSLGQRFTYVEHLSDFSRSHVAAAVGP